MAGLVGSRPPISVGGGIAASRLLGRTGRAAATTGGARVLGMRI